MYRTMVSLSIIVVFSFSRANLQAASVTYFFNNYPTEQGSGTVSGSITVDDALGSSPGVLEASEIIEWQYTLTGHDTFPDITFGTASQQGATLQALIGGVVNVSPTALTVPQPQLPQPGSFTQAGLLLRDMGSTANGFFGSINWGRSWTVTGDGTQISTEQYRLVQGNGTDNLADDLTYWDTFQVETPATFSSLAGKDPWVIATIPEPATWSLVVVGLCLASRRRR